MSQPARLQPENTRLTALLYSQGTRRQDHRRKGNQTSKIQVINNLTIKLSFDLHFQRRSLPPLPLPSYDTQKR